MCVSSINSSGHKRCSRNEFVFVCWFVCVPAAAVVAGWFQQCVFLWSDWSAPPPSAELTDETEHPSVCPPTGSSYHSKDREREMERNIILHFSLCLQSIRVQKQLVDSFLLVLVDCFWLHSLQYNDFVRTCAPFANSTVSSVPGDVLSLRLFAEFPQQLIPIRFDSK